MKRIIAILTLVLWLGFVFLPSLSDDCQSVETRQDSFDQLIDAISETPVKSDKYNLVVEFFDRLTVLRITQTVDSVQSVLFNFFSRLHPKVKITDPLAVLQTVEWIYNCFALVDSGGVFFTNGDADTYAAWYLQRVEGTRPDLLVVSLPFLVERDYRQSLMSDNRFRMALNLSEKNVLSIPPSTSETQDALVEIVTRQVKNPKHPSIHMALNCGIQDRFGKNLVDLGLVYAYQDPIQPRSKLLDLFILRVNKSWLLSYASMGAPKDTSYAAQVPRIQYLTALLRLVPEFEESKRYQDMNLLFERLEPTLGEDWRFLVLRYKHCHKIEEECQKYMYKLKQYAAQHPDDRKVQEAVKELENK